MWGKEKRFVFLIGVFCRPPDLYHTCYTLSGLSVAQHCEVGMNPLVIGDPNNELLPTHPMFNVPPKAVWKSYVYFTENIWDMYGEGGVGAKDADEVEVAEKNKEKKMGGDDESISDCGANDERSSSARRGESMSSTNDDDRSGVASSGFGGGGKDKDTDSMITDDDGISVSTSATSN